MGEQFLTLQPGTIVNGRYEIVKCLGTGSMGMVYACRHRELSGHIVAMKVLFSEVARDETAAARFRNEIVASYGVSHPNVVRAYEYFRDGDLIAFTMEYIGGGDLADRMSGDDEISIDETINMLCQMASGVQAIHDARIIHRDLKPENILLTAQGDVKITDFGIARLGTGPRLTEHGGVVGTLDYVSPEYLERGHVDERSDIYALGVLAFEMITGDSPFKGKSVMETINLRLKTDAEPPHHLRPDCPVALSSIVLKAMTRDPEQRYQAAREMLEDLDAVKRLRQGDQGKPSQRKNKIPPKPLGEEISLSVMEEAAVAVGGAAVTPYGAMGQIAHASEVHSPHPPPGTRSGTVELRPAEIPVLSLPGDADVLTASVRPAKKESQKREGGRNVWRKSAAKPQTATVEDRLAPSVTVSTSSVSAERIKQLHQDLWTPRRHWPKLIMQGLLVCALGFVLGMVAFHVVLPDIYSAFTKKGTAVENKK